MAGTFNSKTGYLTVTGINVQGGEIVIDGNVFDSDMISTMISTSIADMVIDSDTVMKIAENVRLNNLIDSDAIVTISSAVFSNASNLRLDSDFQDLSSKYAVILANDAVQETRLDTAEADILTLSERIDFNDSDIAEIEGDVTGIYTRLTDIENENLTIDARVDVLDTVVGISGGGGGGHEDRITNLEANIAALQAQIAALTINDLTDVDTTGVASGDALVWNGTDFVPVAN